MLHAKFHNHRTITSEGKDLKIFTIYGRGGHLGYVTWTIYIYFLSPFPKTLRIKFGFDWPSGLRERKSLKTVAINMYLAPGVDRQPPGVKCFHLHIYSVNYVICSKFSPITNFVTVFPILIYR